MALSKPNDFRFYVGQLVDYVDPKGTKYNCKIKSFQWDENYDPSTSFVTLEKQSSKTPVEISISDLKQWNRSGKRVQEDLSSSSGKTLVENDEVCTKKHKPDFSCDCDGLLIHDDQFINENEEKEAVHINKILPQDHFIKLYKLDGDLKFFECPGPDKVPHYELYWDQKYPRGDIAKNLHHYYCSIYKSLDSEAKCLPYYFESSKIDNRLITCKLMTDAELKELAVNKAFVYSYLCCCGLMFIGASIGGGEENQHVGVHINNMRNIIYKNGCSSTFLHQIRNGHHCKGGSFTILLYCEIGIEEYLKFWLRDEYSDFLFTVRGELPAKVPDSDAEKILKNFMENECGIDLERREACKKIRSDANIPKASRLPTDSSFDWELFLEGFKDHPGEQRIGYRTGMELNRSALKVQRNDMINEFYNNRANYGKHDYQAIVTEKRRCQDKRKRRVTVKEEEAKDSTYSPVLQVLEEILETNREGYVFSDIVDKFFLRFPEVNQDMGASLLQYHIRYGLDSGSIRKSSKGIIFSGKFFLITRREIHQILPKSTEWFHDVKSQEEESSEPN